MKTPKDVSSVWDNEGETVDRYTVVLNYEGSPGYPACLGMNS